MLTPAAALLAGRARRATVPLRGPVLVGRPRRYQGAWGRPPRQMRRPVEAARLHRSGTSRRRRMPRVPRPRPRLRSSLVMPKTLGQVAALKRRRRTRVPRWPGAQTAVPRALTMRMRNGRPRGPRPSAPPLMQSRRCWCRLQRRSGHPWGQPGRTSPLRAGARGRPGQQPTQRPRRPPGLQRPAMVGLAAPGAQAVAAGRRLPPSSGGATARARSVARATEPVWGPGPEVAATPAAEVAAGPARSRRSGRPRCRSRRHELRRRRRSSSGPVASVSGWAIACASGCGLAHVRTAGPSSSVRRQGPRR